MPTTPSMILADRVKVVVSNPTRYDHLEHQRKRQRANTASSQDIGDIPEVVNWERRLSCQFDLRRFFKTYLEYQFFLPFCPDHITCINKAQRSALEGDLFAQAMPRGSGKSEIAKGTGLWAGLYGHRAFILFIGATGPAATEELLDGVRYYFEASDKFPLLLQDFPEIVFPILALDGEPRRQLGQRCQGEKTNIWWGGKHIVFPTVPPGNWIDGKTIGPPPGGGCMFRTTSITGRIRGFNVDGRRPDFVIPDDPQTDESAASPSANRKIERILSRAVLGLGGHGKRIAGLMPCTVIEKGDAIDRILDHTLHPEWDSARTKMLYAFPSSERGLITPEFPSGKPSPMEYWERYRDIRNNYNPHAGDEDKKRAAIEATEYYRQNCDWMRTGSMVAWPERFYEGQLDGLQRAMDFYFDDKEAFFSEGQNDPLAADLGNVKELTPDDICKRLSNVPKQVVPREGSIVTAAIDVQHDLLYYMVTAWRPNFTGWVVDYGTWPDQKRSYFTKDMLPYTFARVLGDGLSEEALLKTALQKLCDQLFVGWKREDGSELRINRLLIDSGYQTKWVYEFVRQQIRLGRESILPSKGDFFDAGSRKLIGENKELHDRVGFCWHLPIATVERGVRLFHIDVNQCKSFVHARLALLPGQPSALSLFGNEVSEHRLIADHLTAEYRDRQKSERTQRTADKWQPKPGRIDNDWFDTIVQCTAAASEQGAVIEGYHANTSQKMRTGKRKSWAAGASSAKAGR